MRAPGILGACFAAAAAVAAIACKGADAPSSPGMSPKAATGEAAGAREAAEAAAPAGAPAPEVEEQEVEEQEEGKAMAFSIKTTAFADGERIPVKHTGDGPDRSPPLSWSGAPAGTRAFALIVDDPDAPVGTWDHWLVYDVPGSESALPEGVPGSPATLASGAKQGKNSWGRVGWGGPAPPPGKPHRYFFKLLALSAPTGLAAGADKKALLAATQGKVLGEARLVGSYGR